MAKNCRNCGEENRDTVAFCTQCGATFEPSGPPAAGAPQHAPPPPPPAPFPAQPRPGPGPVPGHTLEIVQGSGAGRQIPVNGILQVGRDPTSGLILNDDLVSRRHLRVTADPQGLLVEDLGSRNGTFVNGVRVAQPTRLRPGDRLTVGDTILVVR